METDDILSDQMQISRPELLVLLCAVSVRIIADTCDIVCKGIQPYIHNVFVIEIYRNTPFERSTGYTQILQTRQKEVVHHFILTADRLDKFRMCIDMLDQTICIFAHFEEVCFFLCRLTFSATVRAFAVYKL